MSESTTSAIETSEIDEKKSSKPSLVDVYWLAMTIALGGQYYRWNQILTTDFWAVIFYLFLNSVGYICFAVCMAEMSGTMPFSGGIYGFVRAFIGPLSGYVVSRFEIIMIICYVATIVQWIGTFPTLAGISSQEMEPLWWLFYYVVCTSLAVLGCNYKAYWMCIRMMGSLSLLLLIVYIFGSFPTVNYSRYVYVENNTKAFDLTHFEDCFKIAGMFRGLQFLPLVSIKVQNAKTDVSRGLILATITLFITAFGIVFTACTQYPGAENMSDIFLPLTNGFSTIFHLPLNQAIWLSFPGTFASFYGVVWAYGRQLSSMAKSGLLPEIIGSMTSTTDTPYIALFVGGIVSYLLALCCFYDHLWLYDNFSTDISQLFKLSSYVVNMFFFVSYLQFKTNYSSLPREFVSPFGIVGAYVGFITFGINAIGSLIEDEDREYCLYFLILATIGMVLYYYVILHNHQHFSEEEKEQLFKAYLMNANAKSRAATKKKRVLPSVATAAKNNFKLNNKLSNNSSNVDNNSSSDADSAADNNTKEVSLRLSPPLPSSSSSSLLVRSMRKFNQVTPHEEVLAMIAEENGMMNSQTTEEMMINDDNELQQDGNSPSSSLMMLQLLQSATTNSMKQLMVNVGATTTTSSSTSSSLKANSVSPAINTAADDNV